MDSQQLQQATSNPNIQRVLQKQASLSKRLSSAAHYDPPSHLLHQHHQPQQQQPGGPATVTRIKIPETSFSHTETAV